MTTKGQMNPASWQGEFNGVPGRSDPNIQPRVENPFLRSKAIKLNPKPRGSTVRVLQDESEILIFGILVTTFRYAQFSTYFKLLKKLLGFWDT